LRDAIRALTPKKRWRALLRLVGGRADDAVRALSGQMAGRLLLDAEIASKSVYTMRERKRIRAFERLRAVITAEFDARRRGDLILKGFTEASPAKPLAISPDLELAYDFARGTAQSGDIRFHGVTACIKAEEPESVRGKDTQPPVSEADLAAFFKKYLETTSRAPSMDGLWEAAKEAFSGKHVSRERVRKMHRGLIPAPLRRPGPRK